MKKEYFGHNLQELERVGFDKNGIISIEMAKPYIDPEHEGRTISIDMLKEIVNNYDREILIAPVLKGHPIEQTEQDQLGQVLDIWLDNSQVLIGKVKMNQMGVDSIMKKELNYCSVCIPPSLRDPEGNLIGETGLYLMHLALLGSSTPQILGLKPINQELFNINDYYNINCYSKNYEWRSLNKLNILESIKHVFKKRQVKDSLESMEGEEMSPEEIKAIVEGIVLDKMTSYMKDYEVNKSDKKTNENMEEKVEITEKEKGDQVIEKDSYSMEDIDSIIASTVKTTMEAIKEKDRISSLDTELDGEILSEKYSMKNVLRDPLKRKEAIETLREIEINEYSYTSVPKDENKEILSSLKSKFSKHYK